MKWWDCMPRFSFFECWILSQLFHSPLSTSSRCSLVLLHFLPMEWYHLHIWGCWYFSQESWFQPSISHYVLCLLEATVRTLYGKTDRFRIEKGVWQHRLLSSCLFNLYTEHIMRNAGLDGLQAGIKVGKKNINNIRYVDDTTLTAEIKLPIFIGSWRKQRNSRITSTSASLITLNPLCGSQQTVENF